MHFSAGNADKRGDVAVQVEQRVHLDGGFVLAEPRPGEQRKAQIDGGRVQCIQTVVQLHTDGIGRMQRPRDADQHLRKIRKDSPVVHLISIRQRGARHTAAKAHVVELAAKGSQTGLNVAETVAVRQLGEGHRQILIPAGETARSLLAAVASHAPAKLTIRQKAQQLREDCSALVHSAIVAGGGRLFRLAAVQIAASQKHHQLSAAQGFASGALLVSRTVVMVELAGH